MVCHRTNLVKSGKGAAKRRAFAAALFGLVSQSAWPANADATDYSIATIESDLRPMDEVGPLRVGMLCLPKGKLLWRDIAKPTDAITIAILSRRLAALGLAVPDLPDPLFSEVAPLTKYRIRVTFESLAMKLCVPGLGIGNRPSGNGIMIVRWDTFDRLTRTQVETRKFEVALTIEGRDARNDNSVIKDALNQSADQYVLARRSSETASPK